MPPKKNVSDDSEDEFKDASDMQLIMLQAKREAIFAIVQKIYDCSLDVQSCVEKREYFLDESSQIDSLRDEFKIILDKYNSQLLSLNPTAKPEYGSLLAFESLYSRIKRTQMQYSQSHTPESRNVTSFNRSKPKLPAIEIPSFSGEIREWQLFYASFNTIVHQNSLLTDAEKLYYLLSKLTGKALSQVSGIAPCAENYDLILQTLTDKYDDKRMLVSMYLNQLFEFKPIQCASVTNFELFTDNFTSVVRALQNLKLENLFDLVLIHIALKKIDSDTARAFEINYSSKMPTFDNLVEFIKNRAKALELSQSISLSSSRTTTTRQNNNNIRRVNNVTSLPPRYQTYLSTTVDTPRKCLCSNITHEHLYKCADFNKLSPHDRFKCVKDNNACVNCLSLKHRISNCSSISICRVCGQKHHTLLHFKREAPASPPQLHAGAASTTVRPSDAPTTESPIVSNTRSDIALCTTAVHATNNNINSSGLLSHTSSASPSNNNRSNTILLSTAQVIAYDFKGNQHIIRALLDSASQSHFITNKCCDQLGIKLQNTQRTVVKGFGGVEKEINSSSVNFKFYSRFDNNIKFDISPLVVDQITDLLPTAMVDTAQLPHLSGLPLADELYSLPNNVDLLIGASLFPHLLLSDVIHGPRDVLIPPAIRTVLGYVIMGSVPTISSVNVHQPDTCCHILESTTIDSLVKRFWELEELPSFASPIQSSDEVECETHYKSTTTRDPVSGTYTVALPFKEDIYTLGDSFETAYRRFMCLERRLQASPKLRTAYDDVIRDYIAKDYVSLAPPRDSHDPLPVYIIPHHGVVREDKTTTKLRIVLDASASSTSSRSLNDILHSGPNLQGDLFSIILNFRLYSVGMTADCRQQFLQINVRETDRRFQCFLYRFNPRESLLLYQFNRVCFGLKSSPYHALRTVKQLIEDDGFKYPLASKIASTSLYMDDIVFSIPSENEAVSTTHQLIDLFKGAQWDLVKWNSNSQYVLNHIPASHKVSTEVEFDKTVQHKILGLHWSTENDTFYFKISVPTDVKCTKRSIMSTVARLWDVMGFAAPTILYAKLLIKQLWLIKLDFDDLPPPHIIKMWQKFCDELPCLNNLYIPRHIGVSVNCDISLVGFSDASELAYGAVVYAHVSTASGNNVRLVCAKSKVAPTKPLTIARLELCGALLMSKLLRTVLNNYSHNLGGIPIKVYAFIDSKVALYWIKGSPHRWQTFVSNRVVQISEYISPDNFYHVSGTENPADILSRGITPLNLISHSLWLHGPPWISMDPSKWPLESLDGQSFLDIPEQKILSHTVCSPVTPCLLYNLALRLSSWTKLLRIIVYIFRFVKLLPRRGTNIVTVDDINYAEIAILRALQRLYFVEEYYKIINNKFCTPALNRLRPFVLNGLILVGGRLENSMLNYSHKHPILLPRNDHVVNMIIDHYHLKHLHAGPELLMSILRQKFWILSARRIVRRRVHLCNTCFRLKPRPTYPLMADLPDYRTRQAIKAFTHTGCDYAGPIAYTPVRRRGVRSEKAYLCIFTCLTTRAVHIEVATDLSTPSFLAALKRFLSRRGPCLEMFTDNGTNYKGADSYLRDLYKFLNNEYRSKLEEHYAESRIKWKFICPNSPHFGGAWESIVKVVKSILFRVIGKQLLSYEELSTVLTQIECLLNSRPLTVLSSDPAEPTALTPSHFLHTAPLLSLPAPEIKSDPVSLLHRHSLLDNVVQSFWKRWRLEYLHGLQVRQKWNIPSVPITPGTVVVVMNDNVPPLAWPLAIVEIVHPSKDGVVRVCTVRTVKGTYLRPVVRLCPLPKQ